MKMKEYTFPGFLQMIGALIENGRANEIPEEVIFNSNRYKFEKMTYYRVIDKVKDYQFEGDRDVTYVPIPRKSELLDDIFDIYTFVNVTDPELKLISVPSDKELFSLSEKKMIASILNYCTREPLYVEKVMISNDRIITSNYREELSYIPIKKDLFKHETETLMSPEELGLEWDGATRCWEVV